MGPQGAGADHEDRAQSDQKKIFGFNSDEFSKKVDKWIK